MNAAAVRVLVVEDNETELSLAVFVLRVFGHEPLMATTGWQAIEMGIRDLPDLILLDLVLPDIDAFEALRLMRDEPALDGTPIVALTTLMRPGQREGVLRAGFDGYIPRPVVPPQFASLVYECSVVRGSGGSPRQGLRPIGA